MSEQTKFKVGQVWEDRRGELNKILNVGENALCVQVCSTNYDTSNRDMFHHSVYFTSDIPLAINDKVIVLVKEVSCQGLIGNVYSV